MALTKANYRMLEQKEIYMSLMDGATGDEKFLAALALMKADATRKIVVDGNYTINNTYTVDYYIHMEGSVDNASLRFAPNNATFLILYGSACRGSIIRDINFNGNNFDGNFFNSKTLLKIQSEDPNNTGNTPINILVDNCKFEWCDRAISIEAASSSSFNDIRIQNCVYGVFITGAASLENSFLRLNILAARHAVQIMRYGVTPSVGRGQVPQGNYFVNCTLVLQYADALRSNGSYTDNTIDDVCAAVFADCGFDYGFSNCWIEANLLATGSTKDRLGHAVKFVQSVPKSYIGSLRFDSCAVRGTKFTLSGGSAAGYNETGMTGTLITDCNILFYRNRSFAQEFYVGNYLGNVIVQGNNFVVLGSNKKCIVINLLRDSSFSQNFILYENNTDDPWPIAPSLVTEEPLVLSDCTRVMVRNNNFNYLTTSAIDYITTSGTNTNCVTTGNECPLTW